MENIGIRVYFKGANMLKSQLVSPKDKDPKLKKSNSLVTKQLLGNVFKTFQNGWILVEMLSFLLVVFRFFLVEFQLVPIHENQQLKTNINEMFENGCK